MMAAGRRPPTLMKTPLFSQSSAGAPVSILVEVRKVYSAASTSSPRGRCSSTSAVPWRTPRDWTESRSPGVGLERVADVAEGGAVWEDDLPIGARARKQLPVQLGAGEGPAGQGHDALAALGDVAEVERFADGCLEAVDPRQEGSGSTALTKSPSPDRWGAPRAA